MQYPLKGGPCDGRLSADYASRPVVGTVIVCGDHAYDFFTDGAFHDIGLATGLPPTASGGGALHTRAISHSWRRLHHVLAVEIPQSVRKSQRGRARLRGLVR